MTKETLNTAIDNEDNNPPVAPIIYTEPKEQNEERSNLLKSLAEQENNDVVYHNISLTPGKSSQANELQETIAAIPEDTPENKGFKDKLRKLYHDISNRLKKATSSKEKTNLATEIESTHQLAQIMTSPVSGAKKYLAIQTHLQTIQPLMNDAAKETQESHIGVIDIALYIAVGATIGLAVASFVAIITGGTLLGALPFISACVLTGTVLGGIFGIGDYLTQPKKEVAAGRAFSFYKPSKEAIANVDSPHTISYCSHLC